MARRPKAEVLHELDEEILQLANRIYHLSEGAQDHTTLNTERMEKIHDVMEALMPRLTTRLQE